MNTIVDDTGRQLAVRIRLERDARGWSLAELAQRAGVAKATVSKIERGEVSPTAVILVRIASAFGLTLAGLLLRAEGHGNGERVSRAAAQPVWRDPATGYVRRQVLSRPDHPLEIVQVQLPAGAAVTLPAASYVHIRQAVWVRQGSLVIAEGGVRHSLDEGDCLPFGPPSDVEFFNETALPCTYVVLLARS
ncbi:helix-turn-helix domain-containing protein [Massilia sp. PAMC28688]|uniref:helix-turn-helix domain-containing protein n=1 Tax=Massilia sp. PAMC28688 TaxID=2861283 RepID=UPI001C635527|nr:helix-turn-helix domain-containing protein [Massilia sp. PAMC28688]QYF92171.1 helix-turn-helix domain-containing protein [Massilia sp. PAMC28688]